MQNRFDTRVSLGVSVDVGKAQVIMGKMTAAMAGGVKTQEVMVQRGNRMCTVGIHRRLGRNNSKEDGAS